MYYQHGAAGSVSATRLEISSLGERLRKVLSLDVVVSKLLTRNPFLEVAIMPLVAFA